MRSGFFIVLALASTLFAATSAEYTWNGTAWAWKETDATVQTRLEPTEGSGNDGLPQTRLELNEGSGGGRGSDDEDQNEKSAEDDYYDNGISSSEEDDVKV